MPPQTPYTNDLDGREPIEVLGEAAGRLRKLTDSWTPAQFERTYAPGKWSARQIFVHLAQTEMALGTRARMALATPAYTAQGFDQDRWMGRDSAMSGREAIDALLAMSAMNRALFRTLSVEDRTTPFTHPEYGPISIDWLIHQMAGHYLHHLKQLEVIAAQA